LLVLPATAPDLEALAIDAPGSVVMGQPFTPGWTGTNSGDADAQQNWTDALYLSENLDLDGSDSLLSTALHTGVLAPGANYEATVGAPVTIPIAGVSRTAYLIVKIDTANSIAEVSELNNVFVRQISLVEPLPNLAPSE